MWRRSLLYLFLLKLLITPCLPRTGMRGSSAARVGSHDSYQGKPYSGYSGYTSGTGSHSSSAGSSGHTFRNALIGGAVGAAGGMLAVEAGKKLFHSNSNAAHSTGSDHIKQCSLKLDNNTQVIWTCRSNEVCCGRQCCPAPDSGMDDDDTKRLAVVLGFVIRILFVAILTFCIVYCVYNLNREYVIDIDDPSRYKIEPHPSYLKQEALRRSRNQPTVPASSRNGIPSFPYSYPTQDPNYYLPGYPPPYPPAYPQCYPTQSPTSLVPPQNPTVSKQQVQDGQVTSAQA